MREMCLGLDAPAVPAQPGEQLGCAKQMILPRAWISGAGICTGDYPGGNIIAIGINSRLCRAAPVPLEKAGMPLHPLLLILEPVGPPGGRRQPFPFGKTPGRT